MTLAARRARTLVLLALAAGPAAGAGPAGAQEPAGPPPVHVGGLVRDASTGFPVPEARVWLLAGGDAEARIVWSGFTGADGRWASTPLRAGIFEVHVEAFGYRNTSGPVAVLAGPEVEVRVDVVPAPLELEPLVVVSVRRSRLEASGFFERRRMGQGSSLTRQEFASRSPARPSDLFRLLPGVSIESSRRGSGYLRYRGCSPTLVLDGVPLVGPTSPDDILLVSDIEAVEVQSGVFFPAMGAMSTCGTVMVWTREGGREEGGKPLTWRRIAFAAGFVVVAVLLTR